MTERSYQDAVQVLRQRMSGRWEGLEANGRDEMVRILKEDLGYDSARANDVIDAMIESGTLRYYSAGAEPVALPGDAWLEVRITPANAHTEAGQPTIAERRRATGLPVVLEIVQTCDFEALVTWVLAVRSPESFRLARFGDPSRLVVDVRHPR